MALTKKIDFLNGVITESAYIEISTINVDFDMKTANFNVKTYLDKATKDAGLQPMQTEYIHISDTTPMPTDKPVLNFSTYFSTGNIKANAETYLLTLDKYKDCVTVE